MEEFLNLIRLLALFIIIVIATSPIFNRIDKIISQLENIENLIICEVEDE